MDQGFRKIHAKWLQCKKEEERENATAAEMPMGVKIPTALAGLPTAIDIDTLSILHSVKSLTDPFTNDCTATTSPTLSISTVSDLTPTELSEEIGEGGDERTFTRHETFYLEDGNVEIVCGDTIFRVHSPIVSFSSHNLRAILSPLTLLNAPMPEGCPRRFFKDSAGDFAVLLKMIYTPGYVLPPHRCGYCELTGLLARD